MYMYLMRVYGYGYMYVRGHVLWVLPIFSFASLLTHSSLFRVPFLLCALILAFLDPAASSNTG